MPFEYDKYQPGQNIFPVNVANNKWFKVKTMLQKKHYLYCHSSGIGITILYKSSSQTHLGKILGSHSGLFGEYPKIITHFNFII